MIARVDADRFDAVIGRFVQRMCTATRAGRAAPGPGRGRQDRPWRAGDRRPARHLFAVIDQHTRVVLGQINVDGKTNELIGSCAAPGRAENFVVAGRVDTA